MSMISELVKELRWIAEHEYQSRNSEDTIRRAADTIEMLSEKARESKQGEWINKHEWENGFFERECSVCGAMKPILMHTAKINFCPSCGARMKGADDEQK